MQVVVFLCVFFSPGLYTGHTFSALLELLSCCVETTGNVARPDVYFLSDSPKTNGFRLIKSP